MKEEFELVNAARSEKSLTISCGRVASKRALALMVDYIMISAIVLIPLAFRTIVTSKFGPLFDVYAVILGVILLVTPLPIIYWRLFFKVFMRVCTPGEQILGIASFSRHSGSALWASEIGYALIQYGQVAVGLIGGFLIYYAVKLFTHSDIAALCAAPLVFFLPLYYGHFAATSKSHETSADTALAREVKLI